MMKKMLFACCVLIQILAFSACKEKENGGYQVSSVSIRLVYPEGSGFEPVEGVSVTLKNTSGSTTFSQSTNAEGVAVFEVPQGIYEASASDKRVADKHACDISCVTHLSFSVPHHLPDFTPDYTFYTLIYLSSLCLEALSVSVERGDMISYYVEKLHARHFSAVRNFRAPPFAVVA